MIGAPFLSKMVYKNGKGWDLRARGGCSIFFRRGCTRLLLYFNRGGGGGRPLHPPPRSAPEGGDSPYKILFCTPPGGFAGETHYRVEPRLPLSAINN